MKKLGKDPVTVSEWGDNSATPDIKVLFTIVEYLNMKVKLNYPIKISE